MKSLLRTLLLNIAVVFFAAWILPGLSYSGNFQVLILTAAALGLVNMVVRPIVKLVTLPINLLTLGIFSWVINVLMLYLVTRLVPGFEVAAFHFDGWTYQGLILPAMEIGLLSSYVLSSFLISLLTSILGWLFD
jgi:putative membrane protein